MNDPKAVTIPLYPLAKKLDKMKVKLISADLKTGFFETQTKPDKRYKKGYRVLQEGYSTYELRIRTTNPNGTFSLGCNVSAPWGQFRVVRANYLSLDGEIELMQLRMCEVGNSFQFKPEFDLLLLSKPFGEGSI